MKELATTHKLALARALRSAIMLSRRAIGQGPNVRVRRRGVNWHLDLNEGIDLAIYALGGFELRTLRMYRSLVRHGDSVLDIGANVGAHTLPLAQLVGSSGRVIAFEPTRFAFDKLRRNLMQNPQLATRVTALQVALMESAASAMPDYIYSSWPLDAQEALHEIHGGQLRDTNNAVVSTVDQAVESLGLARVDFVKLDVDGYEPQVLAGAVCTLRRFRPKILMEWAPYLFEGFEALLDPALDALRRLGYRARIAGSRAVGEVPRNRGDLFVPMGRGASINLLLEPL
jgi:FkbM family methyltransferase